MLTPENIRALYDVEADVHVHPRHGPPDRGPGPAVRDPARAPMSSAAASSPWSPRSALGDRGHASGRRPSAARRSRCRARSIARCPGTDNVDAQIFFVARLPRVLAGALVGATLAAAGVVLQALLRNPLATPFTLGVSAGASLGAMLAVAIRLEIGVLGVTSVPLASFAGSLVATAHRLCARLVAAARPVDQCAAAGGRDAELVLLGADPVRAVPRGFRRVAARHPVDDGRPGRRQLLPDSRGAAVHRRRRSRCSRCCRARSTC